FQRIVAFVAADLAGLFPESLRFRGLSFVADLAFGSEIPFDRDEVERRLRAVPTVGDDRNSILQMVWSGSALFGPELHHGDNARTLFRRLGIIADKEPPGDGAALDRSIDHAVQ